MNVPAGFRVDHSSPEEFEITYRTKGMGCLLTFLVVLVVVVGGALATVAITHLAVFWSMLLAEWWAPLAFAAAVAGIIYYGFFALFHLFGSTRFSGDRNQLVVTRKLFGLGRSKTIPAHTMTLLRQVKDGGEGEDTFPSWGLKLMAARQVSLLERQPLEKSDWLGKMLSEWFKIPFEVSEQRGQT